ncbi:MAG: glycosyltransferase [Patescibacteria group bacterium]
MIAIHLVTWNGAKYIPELFASLRGQQFREFQLVIYDNGSVDATVVAIEKQLQEAPAFNYTFTKGESNIGFAPAHNLLMRESTAEYVLLLNQDMQLMPEYVLRLKQCLDGHPDAGIISGRLMKWQFGETWNHGRTDVIDSLGLRVLRNRRVTELHTGERWTDVSSQLRYTPDGLVEVFGVSGAAPMIRRAAAMDVALDGQMFDESYFSYKEDVDLAWRMRSAGWNAYLVPDAVIYHDRSAAGPRELADSVAAANRASMRPATRAYSYRNHLFTLFKNEYITNYLRDWPWIEWYEWKKFVYLLFREPRTWVAGFQVARQYPQLMRKRKMIKSKRRVKAGALRKWWMK